MIYAIGKVIFWVLLKLFFAFKVEGGENIPRKGGFLLAGNHLSYLDPIVLGVASCRPLNYLARDTLFKNPVFGWILRQVNVSPLKRNFADIGAIKSALKCVGCGRVLVLFPEGTRSVDGELGKGLSGVGFLSRKSNVPVVPVYVFGTDKVMPRGTKFIKFEKIKVIFGKPVSFSEDKNISDEDRTKEIMEQIGKLKRGDYGKF